MTEVVVDAGICGFRCVVEVSALSRRKVSVALHTDCEMLNAMNPELNELDLRPAMKSLADSLVYRIAARHSCHVACPVPSAILKAIEVELGAALPRDVAIRFEVPDPP